MKLHVLKIKRVYAYAKLTGNKMFEIRENDRNFEVGDLVAYRIFDSEVLPTRAELIENNLYKITYVSDFEQKKGYVVYGEKLIDGKAL